MSKKNSLFLILTVLVGIFILFPYLDFQLAIAQGDHGRDLYAFEQTLHGAKAYQDYWWVYGPLMPYYYSAFFKWLGINIPSVLIGKMLLQLLAGIFLFQAMSVFVAPWWAVTATIWFWVFQPDFFHTYNHIGGITTLLAITYCQFLYIRDRHIRYQYIALIPILLLAFIKVNFAVFALFAFLISSFITDLLYRTPLNSPKKYFYFLSLIVLPLVTSLVYFLCLKGLPVYVIRQCIIYLKEDHPHNMSLFNALSLYLNATKNNITVSWPNGIFAVIIILSGAHIVYLILKKKWEKAERRQFLIVFFSLGLYLILMMHEFLASGVFYCTFWADPFKFMLMFLVLAYALKSLSRSVQALLLGTVILLLALRVAGDLQFIAHVRIKSQYLNHPRGKIFVFNHPLWIRTVLDTTQYLSEHLKTDEMFLALPYDPIYYYLLGRKSPTQLLIYFEHINIPVKQEELVIRDLEINKVNYVVLSSRMNSGERGLGHMGETYCPVLWKYIDEHFKEVAAFGNWQNPPAWTWPHGTKIYQRIQRL
jgi:hypothetical protein